jgi:hypothetical protein
MEKLKGLRKDYDAAKVREVVSTDPGADIPPNINGVGRLVDCKFDTVKEGKENAGEYYFYAQASILSPEEAKDENGQMVRIKGKFTSIIEMMCDTPNKARKTAKDHLDWVVNMMGALGADMKDTQMEQLESIASLIKKTKPMIRFRTWKGGKQTEGKYANQEPRVQHVWTEYKEGESPAPDDDMAAAGLVEAPGGAPVESNGESVDIPALVAAASTKGDPMQKAAQTKLTEMAVARGMTEKEIEDAKSWDDVASRLTNGKAAAPAAAPAPAPAAKEAPKPAETAEPSSDWKPVEGLVYGYRPLKKDGKPGKKIQVEIAVIDEANRKVDVKRCDTKAVLKGLKWDDLEDADDE